MVSLNNSIFAYLSFVIFIFSAAGEKKIIKEKDKTEFLLVISKRAELVPRDYNNYH
jgi:hypothetical protein